MRILGIFMALVLAASPVYAAVCTMTCADDAASCCCRKSAGDGELSYSRPSCCPLEVEASSAAAAVLERSSGAQAPLSIPYQFAGMPRNMVFGDRDRGAGTWFQVPSPGRAPAAEIFLLKSSFLI